MSQKILILILANLTFLGFANAANTNYKVTITNSGNMPISPGALYDSSQALPQDQIGKLPNDGFVQVCQTGNPDKKIEELKADKSINSVLKTDGPILPGESKTFEIAVAKNNTLHFVTMYGKTKDLCGVITVNRRDLRDVANHIVMSSQGEERVVASGGFADPVLPADGTAQNLCAQSTNAVQCLRELSVKAKGTTRTFAGYLPSLVNFLEDSYGSEDVQTLLVPSAGAIQLAVELKH